VNTDTGCQSLGRRDRGSSKDVTIDGFFELFRAREIENTTESFVS